MRVWQPFHVVGIMARVIALTLAITVLVFFGDRSEAEKTFAVVFAALLLVGVVLSVVKGIRRRQALSKL